MKYLIVLVLLMSCSIFEEKNSEYQQFPGRIKLYRNVDYVDQLSALSSGYITSPGIEVVSLSNLSKSYLQSIYTKIVNNNELLFKKKHDLEFYIIKNKTPFFFSLPKGKFFFSSGLFLRYLKNEELFVSSFSYEIIKSLNNIYNKKLIVPIGFLRTERILGITRISLEEKMEINKWSFFAMKRAGYDAFAILNWIQTQNKNTLDFTVQHGDARKITREEFLFKNFIVNEGGENEKPFELVNSSKGFYKLIKDIRSKSI